MMKEIKLISVIGAGVMGNGIAHVCAMGGFDTFLVDISQDRLDQAYDSIKRNLEKGFEKGKVTQSEMTTALSHLKLETDFQVATGNADFVIEAIPEKIDRKLELFNRLDRSCPLHTIFATNTSSLSITEIAASTRRKDKVIGMHFFNPVHIMKLIEMIRGLETSEETYRLSEELAKKLGKETVLVKESPGFVTTRMNALIGNEAFYMLEDGIASARDIDKALKLGLNHPMGPFELVDLVGLDTRLDILKFLHQTLGEKFRPCPLLVEYVNAGRLGKKVGKGVYEYREKPDSIT